jgi:hypothetical protein
MTTTRQLAEVRLQLAADGTPTHAEATYYSGQREEGGAWVLSTLEAQGVLLADVEEGDRPHLAAALRQLAMEIEAPRPVAAPIETAPAPQPDAQPPQQAPDNEPPVS